MIEVVLRCTRDGYTSWSAVARQLGMTVEAARALYDHPAVKSHICAPTRETAAPDVRDVSSPHSRLSKRLMILGLLAKQTRSAHEVHLAIGAMPITAIWARMSEMTKCGLISHDGKFPRTYALTVAGRQLLAAKSERIAA